PMMAKEGGSLSSGEGSLLVTVSVAFDELPDASKAVTVSLLTPTLNGIGDVDHEVVPVTRANSGGKETPSIERRTRKTPTLSAASPLSETLPRFVSNVLAVVGVVILIVGGVASENASCLTT